MTWRLPPGGRNPDGSRVSSDNSTSLRRQLVHCYFHLTLPEPPCFMMDVERNIKAASADVDASHQTGGCTGDYQVEAQVKADQPVASRRDFFHQFSQWDKFKVSCFSFGRLPMTPPDPAQQLTPAPLSRSSSEPLTRGSLSCISFGYHQLQEHSIGAFVFL